VDGRDTPGHDDKRRTWINVSGIRSKPDPLPYPFTAPRVSPAAMKRRSA
jgi:hypothetical protein